MEVNQSKMVLVFKGREPKKDAMKLFSAMFGAAPFSMLFMNVREKMSLCYYCASRVIAGKDALLVDSGVELANAKRAQDAILAQLEAVCRGDFSDELLENAKHSIINAVRSVGDTPSSCVSWLFDAFCTQDSTDPEEIVARYESMTKQDMMEMAQILRLDTVYLMEQEVSHE
jgi:predicted Zn-dependent peptidase